MEPNHVVNLERAMRLGDRLGGHWVQGHVDGIGQVIATGQVGDARTFKLKIPNNLQKYVVEKGSLTISGVSLTVNSIQADEAGFALIPHTWQNTTLGQLREGSVVNLEADILAKYIESLQTPRS